MENLLIIDGNSILNRAFYALPLFKSLDGRFDNAVFGFTKMLLNLITTNKPDYILVAFDKGKNTFRHRRYADYKAGRMKMPEELKSQFQILMDLLDAMKIKWLEFDEIEADDIIGIASKKFDCHKIILSGDKDLWQLIDDDTEVWFTKKGISEVLVLNRSSLMENYNLTPEMVIEKKGLMGDSSDNIPGVSGIGEKTAQSLIEKYKTLENIYSNIDEISGKLKQKLLEEKDIAYESRFLATIVRDYDLKLTLDDCRYEFPLSEDVYKIFEGLDFKTILSKKEYFISKNLEEEQDDEKSENIVEIQSINELKINESVAIHWSDKLHFCTLDGDEKILSKIDEIELKLLKKICENSKILKIVFDSKEFMYKLKEFSINLINFYDVSLAVYISNETEANLNFFDVLKLYNLKNETASNLIIIKNLLDPKLKEMNAWDLFENIETKLVPVLFDMECNGIKVDIEKLDENEKKYLEELNELESKIYNIVGIEFNIKSPKQLQEILFEKLHLQYKGKKSTSIEVLEEIKNQHEVVPLIIRHRKVMKLISTYLTGLKAYIDKDNFIHTTFLQKLTSTGRLSSREPNLQNIPSRDDESKRIREIFISRFKNGKIVSADYNQIELRLMADMSQDENMINAFNRGEDIHSETARKIYNKVEITPFERRSAKAVNFGIIYGISDFGLSNNIGVSRSEAKDFINKYFEIYPKVKTFMEESVDFAKKYGYVKTMFGRIRHIPEINSSNYTVRQFASRVAMNMPLQGTASDIIKMAMIKVYNSLKENNLKSKLILQIHDELIVDASLDEVEIVSKILYDCMYDIVKLKVHLNVDVSYGNNWAEAH